MENTTVILVHGAFADGSSWGNVIPLLENAGYNVIAVQNPLTSFADDVATTRRVIDAQQGSIAVADIIKDAAEATAQLAAAVHS